jgi:hypothetical protein
MHKRGLLLTLPLNSLTGYVQQSQVCHLRVDDQSRAATAAVWMQPFTHPTDPGFNMHVSNYLALQPLK